MVSWHLQYDFGPFLLYWTPGFKSKENVCCCRDQVQPDLPEISFQQHKDGRMSSDQNTDGDKMRLNVRPPGQQTDRQTDEEEEEEEGGAVMALSPPCRWVSCGSSVLNTPLSPYLLPLSSFADTVCLDCWKNPSFSPLISSFIIATAATQAYDTRAQSCIKRFGPQWNHCTCCWISTSHHFHKLDGIETLSV